MASKNKKILKYFFVSIASLLFLCLLSISIVFYVLFTPDRLTPLVVDTVNENVVGEFQLGSLDLTLFSSYPNVVLMLDHGRFLTTSPSEADTLKDEIVSVDKLAGFKKCIFSFNVIDYLRNNEIVIDELTLIEPDINANVDENGIANWDVLKEVEKTDTLVVQKETLSTTPTKIDIRSLRIINASFCYIDRSSELSACADNVSIDTKMLLIGDTLRTQFDIKGYHINVSSEGIKLAEDVRLEIKSAIKTDLSATHVQLDSSRLVLNEINIFTLGSLSRDTLESYELDLITHLNIPDLSAALALIPEEFLDETTTFKTSGALEIDTKIKGVYDENNYPMINVDFDLANSSLDYRSLPNKVDQLNINFSSTVDYSKSVPSYINFNNFEVKSKGVVFNFVGHAINLLDNPYVDFDTNGNIDLGQIKNIIPIEDINMRGNTNFNLTGGLYINDVLDDDYGKIEAKGILELNDINFNYKHDSIVYMTKKSKLKFGQSQKNRELTEDESKLFHGDFRFTGLLFKMTDQVDIKMDRFNFSAKTTPWEDSTQIAELRSNFRLVKADLKIGDTISVVTPLSKGYLNISPGPINKHVPVIDSEVKLDSLNLRINGLYAAVKNGKYNFNLRRKSETNWPVKGYFRFDKFFVYTSSFPKVIRMNDTRIEFRNKRLVLRKAKMRIGKSRMELSGKVFDFQKTLFEDQPMKAIFDVKSKFLNVNQLIKVMNEGSKADTQQTYMSEEMLQEEEEIGQDSTELEIFQVPIGIDFQVGINLSRVIFGDMEFSDMTGKLVMKDERVQLNKFKMKSAAGNMLTTLRYNPTNKKRATSTFNIKFIEIDVANLVNTMPFLDTLLPMTRSFEGSVNFGIRGRSKLNSNLEVIPSTVNAIARAEGKHLVLMDGETFDSVSKTLKFKNRERNMIDSADFQMSIKDGSIEFYPSLVSIDRYSVAIGGNFNLDYNYKFQISVLKSPAPFKAGIDIFGNEEDYDFKLTKAKYKFLFSDKEQKIRKGDTSILDRKAEIIRKISFE